MWIRKLARVFGYSLFGLGVFYCLLLWSAAHVDAYEGGQLKNHNHTSAAGDGGTLSNLNVGGTLSANGPFTVYAGSGTITGNALITGNGQINGTLNVTGAITGGSIGAVSVSTQGFITAGNSLGNTGAFAGCTIANSTLTVTLGNFPLRFSQNIISTMGAATGPTAKLFVLMDGLFVDRENASTGLWSATGGAGDSGANLTGTYVTATAVSAGSHSFCLGYRTDVGTTDTVPASAAATSATAWFRVEEVH